MSEYLQLDEYVFKDRFRPLLDVHDAWIDFDWTDASDREVIERADGERRLWTTLDVDGFVVVSSGRHYVNRIGYLITALPFPENVDIDVYDREEFEEWQERLRVAESSGLEHV